MVVDAVALNYGAAGRLSRQSFLPVNIMLAIRDTVFAITNFLRGHKIDRQKHKQQDCCEPGLSLERYHLFRTSLF